MEWLLEHIDVVLPVALVLLFLFQKMFVREEGEGGPVTEDSEAEQEARRIREEIRRKIVARQQGRTPPPMPGEVEEAETFQPAAYQDAPYEDPAARQRSATFPQREEHGRSYQAERSGPPPVPAFQQPVEPAAPKRDLQDELRIQKERLQKAREAKEAAVRRTSDRGLLRPGKIRGAAAAATAHVAPGDLRGQVLADLATSHSMKRAFILKEVVDRPVGLRDRPDVFSNWS